MKTIIIAYKDTSKEIDFTDKNKDGVYKIEESGLTFISLLGIKDIFQPEVISSIETCKNAGI